MELIAPIRSTALRAAVRGSARSRLGELERPGARDQSGGGYFLKEELQACEILFVEIEMNVLGQVALQSARRKIEFDRSGFGDFADALEAVLLGRGEIGQDFRRDRLAAPGPYREHGRLAGHFAPLMNHVVDEERLESGDGHVFRVALAAILAPGGFSGEGLHLERNPQ